MSIHVPVFIPASLPLQLRLSASSFQKPSLAKIPKLICPPQDPIWPGPGGMLTPPRVGVSLCH